MAKICAYYVTFFEFSPLNSAKSALSTKILSYFQFNNKSLNEFIKK